MITEKRKRGRPRKDASSTATADGATAADYRAPMVDRIVEPTAAPAAAPADRVLIPITAGRVQWGDIKGDVGKLRDAIAAEPGAAEKLGLAAPKEILAPVITEEHARALYQAVNDVFSFTIARQSNRFLPRPEVARVIGYTEAEFAAMCPLTARVLNRYLPARLGAYQDLMLLGVTLYEIHQRKWLQLREYIELKAQRAKEEALREQQDTAAAA